MAAKEICSFLDTLDGIILLFVEIDRENELNILNF
jgi:hypothetical protein